MRLSIYALSAFERFAKINKGIILHPGKPVMTRSQASEMYAVARVPDMFENKVVIGDVRQFLNIIKTYEDIPEIIFEEKRAVISPDKDSTFFPYGVEDRIASPDPKREPGIKGDIHAAISRDKLEACMRRGMVRGYPHAAFTVEDEELYFRCLDFKQPGQLFTEVSLGKCPGEDHFITAYTMENLVRIHLDDYSIDISRRGPVQFMTDDYTYIALDCPSLTGGSK